MWLQYFGRGTPTCPRLWRHDITVLRVAMAINTKIINNTLRIPLCFWFAVNLDLREKKKESLFPCHMALLREIYLATADLSRTNRFSCKAMQFPDYLDREHFNTPFFLFVSFIRHQPILCTITCMRSKPRVKDLSH